MSLPEGWRETMLGEVGAVITGKTPSKNNPQDWGLKYDFITPSDITDDGKFIKKTNRYISEIGKNRFHKMVLDRYSVIVTCIGSDMGKVVINKNIALTNQQINSIMVNEFFDRDFIFYKLKYSYTLLKRLAGSGSTMPLLNKTDFSNILITCPTEKEEQKAIANILSSFDEKIELLKDQNETLEQMAQGFFREWFVDNQKLEWLKPISDINLEILDGDRGKNYPKNDEFSSNGYCLFLSAKNVTKSGFSFNETMFITAEKDNLLRKGKLKRYDIILTTRGTVGNVAYYSDEIECDNIRINSGMVVIRCNSKEESIYMYTLMTSKYFKSLMEEKISGSAQPQLPIRDIKTIEIVYPSSLKEYTNFFLYIYDKIFFNKSQIQTLQKTRDTLLPKLMSGEVRVL